MSLFQQTNKRCLTLNLSSFCNCNGFQLCGISQVFSDWILQPNTLFEKLLWVKRLIYLGLYFFMSYLDSSFFMDTVTFYKLALISWGRGSLSKMLSSLQDIRDSCNIVCNFWIKFGKSYICSIHSTSQDRIIFQCLSSK